VKRSFLVVAILAAFLCGAIVGGAVTTAAARRAGKVFLTAARSLFVSSEEQKLAGAWKEQDMNAALAHATCAFEAGYGDGARYFDLSTIGWSVWGGALTDTLVVEPNAETAQHARPLAEALARARMAVVLERLDRADEAQRQLDLAAKAAGDRDGTKWRDIALQTISVATPRPSE
jgi:hypothetical protein